MKSGEAGMAVEGTEVERTDSVAATSAGTGFRGLWKRVRGKEL